MTSRASAEDGETQDSESDWRIRGMESSELAWKAER